MQHLVPGYQLTENLLLAEELPAPANADFRVWRAFNVERRCIVTVKIYPDRHVEIGEQPAVSIPVRRRGVRILWPGLVLIILSGAGMAAGYWYWLFGTEAERSSHARTAKWRESRDSLARVGYGIRPSRQAKHLPLPKDSVGNTMPRSRPKRTSTRPRPPQNSESEQDELFIIDR